MKWTKTWYGYSAFSNGNRLSVRFYRRGDGKGYCYIARVNESASTSPAKPHATIALAMAEAEAMIPHRNITIS